MQQQSKQPPEPTTERRYVARPKVLEFIGMSSNTLDVLEKEGRFPKRRKLSKRAVRWWLLDVLAWLEDPEGWGAKAGTVVE